MANIFEDISNKLKSLSSNNPSGYDKKYVEGLTSIVKAENKPTESAIKGVPTTSVTKSNDSTKAKNSTVKTYNDFGNDADYERYLVENKINKSKGEALSYMQSKAKEKGITTRDYAIEMTKRVKNTLNTEKLEKNQDTLTDAQKEAVNQFGVIVDSKGKEVDSNTYNNNINLYNETATNINNQITELNNAYTNGQIDYNTMQTKYNELQNKWNENQLVGEDLSNYKTLTGFDYYNWAKENGKDVTEFEKYAESIDDSWLENLTEVYAASVADAINTPVQAYEILKNIVTGEDFTDENSYSSKLSNASAELRQYAYAGTSGFNKWSTQVIDSLIPMVHASINAMAFAGAIGVGSTAATKAEYLAKMNKATSLGTNIILGTQTAGQVTRQRIQEGNDLTSSVLNGVLHGTITGLVEGFDAGNVASVFTGSAESFLLPMGLFSKASPKNILGYLNAIGVSEGAEEIIETLADHIADNVQNMITGALDGTTLQKVNATELDPSEMANEFVMAYAGAILMGTPTGTRVVLTSKTKYNASQSAKTYFESVLKSDIASVQEKDVAYKSIESINYDQQNSPYKMNSQVSDAITLNTDYVPTVATYEETMNNLVNAVQSDIQGELKTATDTLTKAKEMSALYQSALNERGINENAQEYMNLSNEAKNTVKNVTKYAQELERDNIVWKDGLTSKSGVMVDGIYNPDTKMIELNPNGKKAALTTLIHEYTHTTENAKYYSKLKESVKNFLGEDKFNLAKENIKKDYANLTTLDDKGAEAEIVALTLQKELGNEQFVKSLVKYNNSLATRLYEDIKHLVKFDNSASDIEYNFKKAFAENTVEKQEQKKYSFEKAIEDTGKDFVATELRPDGTKKDLIAVHNISESNLVKSLNLGGFAVPSIAITKDTIGHDSYGDISLIFDKNTIDPKNKGNRVYGGDAWTGTYPKIEYETDYKKVREVFKKLDSIANFTELRDLDNNNFVYRLQQPSQLDNYMNENNGEFRDNALDNTLLKMYFLMSNGENIEIPTKDIDVKLKSGYVSGNELPKIILNNLLNNGFVGETLNGSAGKYYDVIKNTIANYYNKEYAPFTNVNNSGDVLVEDFDNYDALDILNYIRKYLTAENKTEIDSQALKSNIKNAINNYNSENGFDKDFANWVDDNIVNEIPYVQGIRNAKDMFTDNGNRRSFKALHDDVTIENIYKVMKKQAGNDSRGVHEGVFGVGTGDTFATTLKSYDSIKEIINDEDRIKKLSEDEWDNVFKSASNRLSDIENDVIYYFLKGEDRNSQSVETLVSVDRNAADFIKNCFSLNAKEQMHNMYMREFYPWESLRISEDDLNVIFNEVLDLKKVVENLPTKYFEAKPVRIVSPSEIKQAIVPNDISNNTIARLKDIGAEILTYDPNIDGDMRRVQLEETGNYKFSSGTDIDTLTQPSNETDSDGKELSVGQVDFFKDSKVRDALGKLLKMYHGTGQAGFNEFILGIGKKNQRSGFKGINPYDIVAHWFTSSMMDAGSYGGNYENKIYNPAEDLSTTDTRTVNNNSIGDLKFVDQKELEWFAEKYLDNGYYVSPFEYKKQYEDIEDKYDNGEISKEEYDKAIDKLDDIGYENIIHDYISYIANYEINNKSDPITLKEMVDNRDNYEIYDFLVAQEQVYGDMAISEMLGNDITEFANEEEAKDSIINVWEEANNYDIENGEDEDAQYLNNIVYVRSKAGEQLNNVQYDERRTYQTYLNITNPYIIDNNGSNSFPYAEVEKALKNPDYDGVIVNNTRGIGYYNDLSTVALVKDSNQIKLTDNLTPTTSNDIRYSKGLSIDELTEIRDRNQQELDRQNKLEEQARTMDQLIENDLWGDAEAVRKGLLNIRNEAGVRSDKATMDTLRAAEKAADESVKHIENATDKELRELAEQVSAMNVSEEALNGLQEFATNTKTNEVLSEPYKKETNSNTLKTSLYNLRQKIVDKGEAIRKIARKNKNDTLQAFYDHYLSSNNIANSILINGINTDTINKGNSINKGKKVKGLRELSSMIPEDQKNDFDTYMYHYLNTDTAKVGKNVFNGVSAEESWGYVQNMEKIHPEWLKVAQGYWDNTEALLNYMVEHERFSENDAKMLRELYPHYVPIVRAMLEDTEVVETDTKGNKFVSTNAGAIKERTGGSQPLQPLDYAMEDYTRRVVKSSLLNDFAKEYVVQGGNVSPVLFTEMFDGADRLGNLDYDAVMSAQDNQPATMVWYDKGEKKIMQIPQGIYDALDYKQTPFSLPDSKVLTKLNQFRRNLITGKNPLFMITNPIKDAQEIIYNSKHALATYGKLPKAFWELCTNGEVARFFKENGGEYMSLTSEGIKDNSSKFYKNTIGRIEQANNIMELTPRLAEFMASIEKGRTKEQALYDAAEVTCNFKRGGDYAKWADRNGATFLNASIQGMDKQVRMIQDAYDQKGWKGVLSHMAKATLLYSLPLMVINALRWKDDEDYEQLSDYIKDNYYILFKYGDGKFFRIPKGRVAAAYQGVLDTLYENGVELASDDSLKEKAVSIWENSLEGIKSAYDNIGVNNPLSNNIFAPAIQTLNNETWYGDPIVSEYMAKKDNAEQYDYSTDKFSVWLGKQLDLSPKKINYLLDQYSGAIGDVLLPVFTPKAETGLSDGSVVGNVAGALVSPLADKFTTDSVFKNQDVTDFYTMVDELHTRSTKENASDEEKLAYKYMNSIKSQMNKLYTERNDIYNSDLNDKDKYAQAKEVQKQVVELAQSGLATYDQIDKYENYAEIGGIGFTKDEDGNWTKANTETVDFINDLDVDKKVELKQRVLGATGITDNGKTVRNSKALEVADAYADMGVLDDVFAYIEANGIDPTEVGLNKTVASKSYEQIKSSYEDVYGEVFGNGDYQPTTSQTSNTSTNTTTKPKKAVNAYFNALKGSGSDIYSGLNIKTTKVSDVNKKVDEILKNL